MGDLSNSYLIFATLAMAVVTFIIRVMPVILPKKFLTSPLLLAVNRGLPLAVMCLLVLSSLQWVDSSQNFVISPMLIAQGLALIVVLLSYHLFKQLFVSMIIGIASLNGFLWLFDKIN